MKKNGVWGIGMLVMVLTFSFVAAGCTSAPKESPAVKSPVVLGPHLVESLRTYMGPQTHTWYDEEVVVYFLDPLRFEAFKAELDAGGEYVQDSDENYTRDWDRGKTFARWVVRSDGRLQLTLANADNSTFEYSYTKNPQASGLTLDELLRTYMVPDLQTWGDGQEVTVYYLDPLRFEAFKAELDAGDEYIQSGNRDENRDWEMGKTFARFAVFSDGRLELDLCREDNSRSGYSYGKVFITALGFNPIALRLNLEESLRTYMGPNPQTWGNGADAEEVAVYSLDPRRFKAFKTELDALGEYQQTGSWNNDNRNWNMGKAFVQFAVLPGGNFQLKLFQADNSEFAFSYTKNPQASELTLDELLRKYMAPDPQTWDDGQEVTVYYLDPLRFEAFKAELGAGGEYIQRYGWDENRDWEMGKTFARFTVWSNGHLELDLCREDNSRSLYVYRKAFQAEEYDDPLRTIKITGYSSQDITNVYGLILFPELPTPDNWAPSAWADPEINGQTITYTLGNVEDFWGDNPTPFTGTGKFFIQLECAPAKNDPSKTGAHYIYSVDGTNPALVDIMDEVTVLEWSKFIWFDDFTGG
ncbi:hypothetical protein FACS189483_02120 [Spirochaetia bacterium]|nr:hypothetical protein FACS189483_02120 [Spirochaetia bacterium]